MARGQKMGRPFKLTDHQKREAIKRRQQGETLADIGRSYNVTPRRFLDCDRPAFSVEHSPLPVAVLEGRFSNPPLTGVALKDVPLLNVSSDPMNTSPAPRAGVELWRVGDLAATPSPRSPASRGTSPA